MRAPAETPEGQGHVKRVVAEMGGKNCVIVDADADLDEVVPEIVHSAFGYAGQKCSAAARVLVHEAAADTLLERLAGAVRVLDVGQAERFATEVPPVIEQEAQERVERYAAMARAASRAPSARCRTRAGSAPPTLVADLPDDSPVLSEEIFGPLLAVARVRDVDEACDVVDALPVRAHRRPVLAHPGDGRARGRAPAGGQPLREPRHHGRDGRPPAVRRQPPLRDRLEGGRAGLPAAVRGAARGHGEHDAARHTRGVSG